MRENGASNDVLVRNLDFLAFKIGDFTGGTFGGEYLVGLGHWFDAGLGVGVYQRTVPSVYRSQVNANGSEIEQDLKLRIVPFTATVRFLPLGHAPVQPYVGAGVGLLRWRYSESGEFVDAADGSIFRDTFVGSGTATAPVVLGGVRFNTRSWGVGGELRYQGGIGELPVSEQFSAGKIDLGGWTYVATFSINF